MVDFYTSIENCKHCPLFRNQPPLFERAQKADIFWVGVSAVKANDNDTTPLSPTTNSGKLLCQIEDSVSSLEFYKTNIVKCLPVDANQKIRYPSTDEMRRCYSHIENEIDNLHPNIIVLLGKQVASYVLKQNGVSEFSIDSDFHYRPIPANGQVFLPVHHPSYIMVYKRKRLDEYKDNISSILNSL